MNDQPGGGVSTYRKRVSYVDQFYSIAELYFHAPERREYKIKLSSSQDSKTYLIVRNVTLDDVFAGSVRKPLKKVSNNPLPVDFVKAYKDWGSKTAADPAKANARRGLDDKIWNGHQGMNTHYSMLCSEATKDLLARHRPGAPELTPDELKAKFGEWRHVVEPGRLDILMSNDKLKLSYSMDDLRQGKPFQLRIPSRTPD